MNARKCVQEKKPYPSQAFAHESSKVEERGKREETGKTEGILIVTETLFTNFII